MQEVNADFAIPLLAALAGSLNANEFCKQIVHRVLRPYECLGTLIGQVGNDAKCHVVGKYGDWKIPAGGILDLRSVSPAAETIRTDALVSIDSPKALADDFPDTDSHLEGAQSFIYSPFGATSRSIGFFAFGFAKLGMSREVTEIEIKMSTMAAEYISLSARNLPSNLRLDTTLPNISNSEELQPNLTTRQLIILQQMGEGKTNQQIGKNLNLSESTIKQESVRIFRTLNVQSRLDASSYARRIGLI